jgi:hypothetical protein
MEHRRTRRFLLSRPVALTRIGQDYVELAGFTKDISSCGVVFSIDVQAQLGTKIEYTLNLISDESAAVNLRCIGKVVRIKRLLDGQAEGNRGFQMAVTLERYEFVRVGTSRHHAAAAAGV